MSQVSKRKASEGLITAGGGIQPRNLFIRGLDPSLKRLE